MLFALTLLAFGIALGGLESGRDDPGLSSTVFDLSLPERKDIQISGPGGLVSDTNAETETWMLPDIEQWESVSVRSGQSLDGIFRRQGFSANTLHRIMTANGETKQLKNIRPGDVFEFQRHEDGSLKRMRYAIDESRYLIIDYDGQKAIASFTEHVT